MFWFFWLRGMWGLSSLTRYWTCTPCIGRHSLNHWTSRGVPRPTLWKPLLGSERRDDLGSALDPTWTGVRKPRRQRLTSPCHSRHHYTRQGSPGKESPLDANVEGYCKGLCTCFSEGKGGCGRGEHVAWRPGWSSLSGFSGSHSCLPFCRVEISTSGCVLCLGRTYLVIRALCIWFCIAYLIKPYLDIVLKV